MFGISRNREFAHMPSPSSLKSRILFFPVREGKNRRKKDTKRTDETVKVGSSEENVGDTETTAEKSPGEATETDKATTEKPSRYQTMGLSAERRQQVGFMVKAILDEGRLRYLRSRGLTADRYKFIDEKYTPENFAIVASQ